MSQINTKKTTTFETPPSSMRGWGFKIDGTPVIIKEDGTTTPLSLESTDGTGVVPNILANKGVGLEADLPTTGLAAGDVYVTSDTFKAYTRIDDLNWGATDLIPSQFISDILNTILYQFSTTLIELCRIPENKLKISIDDTTEDYLNPKITLGNALSKSITSPGANEGLKFETILPIQVAGSDETSDLTIGTSKITFRMPFAMTLTEVRASVSTAPTGSTLIVDINESGTSVLSTKLSIDAGEKTSTTATTPAVISDSALADDAEITIDIDQIGSTIAGAGLKILLKGIV